ncbi:MAG: transglutaminase family protein, partial [Verrucomicrobiota bacterium]
SETSQLTGAGSWNESQQSWMPRTAMCFELRAGRVHVFFPPTSRLEEYLVLLAAVEAAAKEVNLPVVLEGYEPPVDPRLERFKITPDPGVIEVNIHPSQNWEELAHRTETLYEEARNARLCAEKFMLDGRHSGSGGGNHVVLGAEYPGDSLFLRKPGLLRSLITYWQHHPGLSYLFSGLFIGPTSQAPRVDEGRDDRLFELDVAFQQLPENSLEAPWLVDRILRNLLTDLVGNTHRAEFCIDKLYSPDSSSGRLGLLELRAFEMPPHAQMSLAQSLLVRSLIARFWDEPYEHKLVRWGTSLHDRYLLPSFVWNDLREVTEELKTAGIPFALDWLRPFHEFRFPVHGRARYGPVEIELRTALEPWIVLGEEASSQGTSRYVDSSVERVQVQVRGWTEGRHVLLCNGRRIPMYPTGVQEEAVAGVRYKAWNPFSSLHPNIDAQAPLQFDLVDTWNRSSLGGCIYYVSHPGGRSYETFPVNAVEAESRRGNRFWDHGHTPGTVEVRATQSGPSRYMEAVPPRPGETNVPPEEPTPEFPVTLDLRNSPR